MTPVCGRMTSACGHMTAVPGGVKKTDSRDQGPLESVFDSTRYCGHMTTCRGHATTDRGHMTTHRDHPHFKTGVHYIVKRIQTDTQCPGVGYT